MNVSNILVWLDSIPSWLKISISLIVLSILLANAIAITAKNIESAVSRWRRHKGNNTSSTTPSATSVHRMNAFNRPSVFPLVLSELLRLSGLLTLFWLFISSPVALDSRVCAMLLLALALCLWPRS